MKPVSLKTKLTLAFLMIALFTLALIGLFANFILGRQFERYTIRKLNQAVDGAVADISALYSPAAGDWDVLALEEAGMRLLTEGLILRVTDETGAAVWDAQEHNNGMCMRILESMAENMQSYDANFQGGYTETEHPVLSGGRPAGTVYIGYYGPYFYSDADLQFLTNLNRLLLIAAAISLAACVLLGAYLAKHFSGPLADAIDAAGRIASGDYGARISSSSNTREIVALTGSVNRLAASLGEQERLRKRLTADVSHELRTPLTTLQSSLEAMLDGIWEPSEARLTSCREEVLRLAKLVDELGTLSRYDGERLVLNRERFELGALAKRVTAGFEAAFIRKGVGLTLGGAEVWLVADRDKVGQILVNLLGNALKFTPAGGRVLIETGRESGEAVLTVRDTGVGIPPEDLPYIFERFYRADTSRSRETGGSGIGLTIASAITAAHGGSIRAESKLGSGSVFTVRLPVGEAEVSGSSAGK